MWLCPYCGSEIDEYGACCGEVGHAEYVDTDTLDDYNDGFSSTVPEEESKTVFDLHKKK